MERMIIVFIFHCIMLDMICSMLIQSPNRIFSIFPSNKTKSMEQKIEMFNKAPTEAIQTYFLKDLLDSVDIDKEIDMSEELLVKSCEVQSIEMSLQIKGCGRIPIRATKCFGYCSSGQIYVPYKNLMRTAYSMCKATQYKYTKKMVECNDGSIKCLNLKYISKCSCSSEIRKITKL